MSNFIIYDLDIVWGRICVTPPPSLSLSTPKNPCPENPRGGGGGGGLKVVGVFIFGKKRASSPLMNEYTYLWSYCLAYLSHLFEIEAENRWDQCYLRLIWGWFEAESGVRYGADCVNMCDNTPDFVLSVYIFWGFVWVSNNESPTILYKTLLIELSAKSNTIVPQGQFKRLRTQF